MKTRTTCPKNNKYYIRKASGGWNGAVKGSPTISGADVLCNCVGYANGRFNEIGDYGYCKYQLVCNAENFIESAKKQGLSISSKPVTGGIMVWQKGATLGGGDGAGHVAVVEEVYEDGSILTSESGWASWAFKTVRRDNSNGRWGQSSAYKFRGCIINPTVKDGKVVPTPKLVEDGIAGPATIRATQEFFGTPQDGVLSGQNKAMKKYYPSITSVLYGKGGSVCVKKLQKWVGATEDGVLGPATIKKWQKKLGVAVDGIAGPATIKAWQKYLNSQSGNPGKDGEPLFKGNTLIDISEFQSSIDWQKVKASGIKGAIIRCGYRGYEKGTLKEDSMFLNHIKGAYAVGLKVGVYMFTEGINAAEGKEEAVFALNQIKKAGVPISYPVAIDTEAQSPKNERAKNLSVAKRTEVIKAFCEEIKAQGFEPMIYASTSWLNNKLDMSKLPYKVWCAQYYTKCEYEGEYIIWQYTSTGTVPGIKGNVDLNHCYLTEQNPDNKPTEKEQKPVTEPKEPETAQWNTIPDIYYTVAQEVLEGKWGNKDERKKRITEAGYDYNVIQTIVNELVAKRDAGKPIVPSLKLVKTPEQVTADALKFAKWIVNDNRFGYGRKGGSKYKGTKEYSITHSGGCHFCGTNSGKISKAKKAGLSNPTEWEYTYVCNTFVHACYAHSGVPSMLKASGHAWWTGSYQKSKYWTEIKKPAKITDLQPGDVLGWDTHFCLYVGNGKGAEATSGPGGGNPASSKDAWSKSIRICDFTKHFKAAKHVFRFTGSINTTAVIRYGEVSYRVEQLQAYINWYFADNILTVDGIFGDATLAAVKELQKALWVAVDGIVGENTIKAMEAATR